MKGTIISGEEVLKILGEGDLEKLRNVYEMVYEGGPIDLRRCGCCEVHRLIKDCHGNDDVIFIKVER